ncbi:MAG TPA: hypothetical protein VI547_15995, partial [Anaerolineales bacterium]|nr:hypothetical protein [Anaerolineales bacterium]
MAEAPSPPPSTQPPEERRRRLRWLLVLLLLVLLLFCCGQIALLQRTFPVRVDTRSKLTADYNAWPYVVIKPIAPGIIGEIQQDDSRSGANGNIPAIIGPVELWPIFVANLTPTPGAGTPVAFVSPSATVALPPTQTSTPPASATPSQTSGATTPPAGTPPPSSTGTRTPTATNTLGVTATATPTSIIGPTNTSGPTVTPTSTSLSGPTPTNTPTPTATTTPTTVQITGRVFEDTNYSGGNGSPFGGGDVGRPNVTVELYSGIGAFIASTTTNGTGDYTFTVNSGNTYTLRVVSATLGDADTLPAAGFNGGFTSATAEQTFEHNGVAGNGGAGALGGNNSATADTATGAGAGVGDTNVAVTAGATNVAGVDFGFTYNLIVNTNDGNQGSLRQFILNANAIAGPVASQFNIPTTDSNFNTLLANAFVIQPTSALPALTDNAASVDGQTQEANRGDLRATLPDVVIDGLNAGADANGLAILSNNNLIRRLDVRNFSNGNGTGILVDGASGGDNNTIAENYLTLNTNVSGDIGALQINGPADGNNINNNTLTGNNSDGLEFSNTGGSNGNSVTGNIATGNAEDGFVLNGSLMTFTNNTATANGPTDPIGCGIELEGLTNSVITNNISTGNGFEGGICLVYLPSTGNTIGPNNSATGNAGAGIRSSEAGSISNQFTQNAISANGGLGIDLGPADIN